MYPPELIKEPKNAKNGLLKANPSQGAYLTSKGTGGAFTDGHYMNTTRIEGKNLLTGQESQEMLYMWKEGCAYSKWVPSNQFMYSGLDYEPETMTLERFGFIGMEKKCYWGGIGILWKKGLSVEHVMPLSFATGVPEVKGKKVNRLD